MLALADHSQRRDRPYFFLSYAHLSRGDPADRNDADYWVKKIYESLSAVVRVLTGAPYPVGFMDVNLSPGDVWPSELADALATCRVFVPLYSKYYFKSEPCGREWAAFARRQSNHERYTGEAVNAIVPVLFTRFEHLTIPSFARDIQYKDDSMGTEYNEDGLYGIAKLKIKRKAFTHAIYSLARRIVDVADAYDLPTGRRPDYHSLSSLFGVSEFAGGRRAMNVAVDTLTTVDSIPSGRSHSYYGMSFHDWDPYTPNSAGPIIRTVAEVLSDAKFEPKAAAHRDCHADLVDAEPTAPGLLVVDPWATLDSNHRELLQRLDDLNRPWIRAVIPWNRTDAETARCEEKLKEGLRTSLPQMMGNMTTNLKRTSCTMPKTIDEFWDHTQLMVRAAEQEYLRHAPTNIRSATGITEDALEGPGQE